MKNFSTKFAINQTSIKDVLIIEPKVYGDDRGWFMETYNANDLFKSDGISHVFVQDNHSLSKKWTLRGLHYQINKTQGKMIRVASGAILDIAVDLRRNSPTYGKSIGIELTAINRKQLWIPPGFAHGFLTLSEIAETLYKLTDYYDPTTEVTLAWNDPTVGVDWGIPKSVSPLVSPKDAIGLSWDQAPKF